jgi:hypothetical protein
MVLVLLGIAPKPANATDLPDFFVCNFWQDTNSDGFLDDDEYIGIKDSFNSETDSLITFVGYFYDQKGKQIGLKLYEPDGTLYSNKTAEVEFEPTHIHRWWYNVKNMANAATGEWTVKWYLEDELQATKIFTISGTTTKYDLTDDDDWDWFDDWWYDDEEEEPDFFACNKWVDKDDDNKEDRDEYIGIKSSFYLNTDTTITFVSYWYNKQDSIMKMEVISPDNKVWNKSTVTIKSGSTYIHRSEFKVKTLTSKKGFGTWKVKWYLNDHFVDSISVDINEHK